MKKILFALLMMWSCHLTAQYYNTAFGLNGAPLKTALHDIIKNHNSQAWPLWNYFNTTDAKANNTVWDIYSDKPGQTPAYVYQFGTNQCGSYTQENDCYNHEHSWPSTFFNDALPMRSDLHHVYPTDGYVNNKRSNYPFGEVTSTVWISQNGSLLGNSNSYPGYTDNVFEPIDSFKGDLARTYFYMSTRYENEDGGWGNWAMAAGANLTSDAITLLMTWHHNDPVSKKEKDRNEAVFTIQSNRNPFIDYPVFADCIWGGVDCAGVGILEKEKHPVILYPDPATNVIHIETASAKYISGYTLYTLQGQPAGSGMGNATTISVDHLSPGNYLLLLQTGQGVYKKMFTKL